LCLMVFVLTCINTQSLPIMQDMDF
jgi:hypothetical protein